MHTSGDRQPDPEQLSLRDLADLREELLLADEARLRAALLRLGPRADDLAAHLRPAVTVYPRSCYL